MIDVLEHSLQSGKDSETIMPCICFVIQLQYTSIHIMDLRSSYAMPVCFDSPTHAWFAFRIDANEQRFLYNMWMNNLPILYILLAILSIMIVNLQISDFGMSRNLMDESYYISYGGKIPVKWTAPEV